MGSQKIPDIGRIIQNYIQGNVNAKDEEILYSWLNENPENKKGLFLEKDLWETSQIGSKLLNEIETQQWFELQERILAQKNKANGIYEVLKMAAIIVITLGLGWMGHYLYSNEMFSNKQVELKHIEASKGQIKEIFLADGTHVWLNADSKLSFPTNFSGDKREVELRGEAYFEVSSNEKNPFLVKTKSHTLKVTGTQFNICEYPESKIIETTLVEGKVKIINGNFIKDLMPGQQSTFYTETAEIMIGDKDIEIYTAWKEGRYEFRNEKVGKIIQIIERWWDVEFIVQNKSIYNERISGVLRKHKPLVQHLEVMKEVMQFEYNIENDIVKIK